MTTFADRLGLRNEVREFRLGRSFSRSGNVAFHSVRYDFKPASVDTTKMAAVDVGEGHQVTVTVPHIEGSGTSQTVFKGSKKPYLKECVLIVDHATGEITLERLSQNINLKKTRAEGSSKILTRPITPTEHNSKKLSPSQKSLNSPSQKNMWTNNQTSPNQHISPHSRSSPAHRSPTNQASPSMPCLVTPQGGRTATPPVASMPVLTHDDLVMNDTSEVGILSSDSSESSSSGSSSSSDSSDSEAENDREQKSHSLGHTINGGDGTPNSQSSIFSSMPKFSQLSEDLQLSESGSESD
ncbi:ELL-associated factor 2-like [Centruroides sculpturatus]|uniref:ELL-associated factor 2-like n=2 Tax=Centruroides sculpturatus TaxID=218467 RepID=UPI000C6DC609|nr:ELL-associated factor 2-like [Centruroides sculpturatus]